MESHFVSSLDPRQGDAGPRGPWNSYLPLLWDREPTVEEIVRRLWSQLEPEDPGLIEVALIESSEFDRSRTVRLRRDSDDRITTLTRIA